MNDEEMIEKKLIEFHHGIDQTINSAANWNYSMNNFVEIIRRIKDEYTERSKQLQNNVEILLEKKRQLEEDQKQFMNLHNKQITRIKSAETQQKSIYKSLKQKIIDIKYANLDLDRDEANLKLRIERKSESDSLLSDTFQAPKAEINRNSLSQIAKTSSEIETLDNKLKIMKKKETKLQNIISALEKAKAKYITSKNQLYEKQNQIKLVLNDFDDILNVNHIHETLSKRLSQIKYDHKTKEVQIQQSKDEIQHYLESRKELQSVKQQREKQAASLFDRIKKQNEQLCEVQNDIYKFRKILDDSSSKEIDLHSEITTIMSEISKAENEYEKINLNFEEIDDLLRSKTPEEALEERKIEIANEELDRILKSQQKQRAENIALTEHLENITEYQKQMLNALAESHIAEMKAIAKDSKADLEAVFKEIQALEDRIDKMLMVKNVLDAEHLRLSNDMARVKIKRIPIDKDTEIRSFKSKQACDRNSHEISILESKITEISNRIHYLTDSISIKQISIQKLVLDNKTQPHTKLDEIAMRVESSKKKAQAELTAFTKLIQSIENSKNQNFQKHYLQKWNITLDELYSYMESLFVRSYVNQIVMLICLIFCNLENVFNQ